MATRNDDRLTGQPIGERAFLRRRGTVANDCASRLHAELIAARFERTQGTAPPGPPPTDGQVRETYADDSNNFTILYLSTRITTKSDNPAQSDSSLPFADEAMSLAEEGWLDLGVYCPLSQSATRIRHKKIRSRYSQ